VMRVTVSSIVFSILLMVHGMVSAQTGNRAVAFVNDDVITLYELNNKIEELTGKTSEELQSANEQEFFKTREEILDLIIDEKILKVKVKELEIEVTTEDIDNYMEYLKQNNKMTQEELLEKLKGEGLTYEKFRERIKENLERRNVVEREIIDKLIISEEQIAAYYETNKKAYERPGTAHIASIFLVPDTQDSQAQLDELKKKGESIFERISRGEKFEDLAKEFSNGPGAKDGGDLGTITLTDVDQRILNVINSLKDGEVSHPIDMGNRIQIVKLIKKVDTNYIPFEEVKEEIHQSLYNNEMEKRYNEYMTSLKKKNYVKKIL
jgi:peptidyl-prolyl cis-trans isomerase SurA